MNQNDHWLKLYDEVTRAGSYNQFFLKEVALRSVQNVMSPYSLDESLAILYGGFGESDIQVKVEEIAMIGSIANGVLSLKGSEHNLGGWVENLYKLAATYLKEIDNKKPEVEIEAALVKSELCVEIAERILYDNGFVDSGFLVNGYGFENQ